MKTAPRVARLLLAALILSGIVAALTLFPVREWMRELITWIRAAGLAGIAVFAGLYVVVAVVMLPGSMMTIAAGFAWGPVVGTALNSVLSVAAAIVPFLLGRFVARDWVRRRAERYPKLAAIDAATEAHGFKVVLLLRLSLAPYNFLNYALSLTRVRLLDFVLGTWLGMLPAVTLLCYLGSLITDAADLPSAIHGQGPGIRALYWGGFVTTVIGVTVLTRIAQRALRGVLEAKP